MDTEQIFQHVRASARVASLSKRDRQICEVVAKGLSHKEAAFQLGIAHGTLKVYLSERIYKKLGVENQAGLIRFWIEHVEVLLGGDCSNCAIRQSMLAVIGGSPVPFNACKTESGM